MSRAKCALSVDLESWVHRDFLFNDARLRKKIDDGYIVKTTDYLLSLLSRYQRKLTFFVVSEIFDWYPDLIIRIQSEGHEIAHHTHTHRRIVSEKILIEELTEAEKFLEKFKPMGFRAPEARLDARCVEILASYGFKYDSSSYGILQSSQFVHSVREVPISTIRFGRTANPLTLPRNISKSLLTKELPLGSGFFLSALGRFALIIPDILRIQNEIPVLFVHPWQINPWVSDRSGGALSFRSIAMQLYSRKCVYALVHLLKEFETMRLCDLTHELE